MGVIDVKVVEFLVLLFNIEVKFSYNMNREWLYVKLYLFMCDISFYIGYIGLLNLFYLVLISGLEWNLKIIFKEIFYIIEKFFSIFEIYWELLDFEWFDGKV